MKLVGYVEALFCCDEVSQTSSQLYGWVYIDYQFSATMEDPAL